MWLHQLPTSRPALHTYVPWESRYTRQCRIRAVLMDMQLLFPQKDAAISTPQPVSRTSVTPQLQATWMVPDCIPVGAAVSTQPLPRAGSRQCLSELDGGGTESSTSSPHLKRKREIGEVTVESPAAGYGDESCISYERRRTVAYSPETERWTETRRQAKSVKHFEPDSLPMDGNALVPERRDSGQDGSQSQLSHNGNILHSQSSRRLSDDQFVDLWPYCFFHAYHPGRFASDDWKSCRTPNKAISHVVTHAIRRHGLIRGVHQCGQGRLTKYLTACRDLHLQETSHFNCLKCKRIAEWTEDDVKSLARTHKGPSVCLRCYAALQSRMDLWLHLHAPVTCPDREQSFTKAKKSRILYEVFCSAYLRPVWNPPPATSLDNWGLEQPNYLANDSNDGQNASVPTLCEGTSDSMEFIPQPGVFGFLDLNEEDLGISPAGDRVWKETQSDQFPNLQNDWEGEAMANDHSTAVYVNQQEISYDSTMLPLLPPIDNLLSYECWQDG